MALRFALRFPQRGRQAIRIVLALTIVSGTIAAVLFPAVRSAQTAARKSTVV